MSTELESYKAKAIELASFIEYSDNSVVSKTLVDFASSPLPDSGDMFNTIDSDKYRDEV